MRRYREVAIPESMRDADVRELNAYVAVVSSGNSNFLDKYFALENQAQALGYSSIDALLDDQRLH